MNAQPPAVGLSISELAERTAVPQATIRTWESRYGLPSPRRLPGGHRRYSEQDVAFVEAVLRHRASGLNLQGAISRAAESPSKEHSVFAGLRRRYPELGSQLLSKVTLLALTRAVEDECCARAQTPVLFASFQRERYYQNSQARWHELSRTARAVVLFADFETPSTDPAESPRRLRIPEDAPLRREWLLVCDSADYPACVTGWEIPGQEGKAQAVRKFETIWTVDPEAVREAALICAGLAEAFGPQHESASIRAGLTQTLPTASPDLRRALSLFNRMVGYVDAANQH